MKPCEENVIPRYETSYLGRNQPKVHFSEYGCGLILARSRLSSHLLHCPANIIMCKAEWNRWPLYTIDRRRHIPFRQANPRAKEGQLGNLKTRITAI
jgi:hypothetical protein